MRHIFICDAKCYYNKYTYACVKYQRLLEDLEDKSYTLNKTFCQFYLEHVIHVETS